MDVALAQEGLLALLVDLDIAERFRDLAADEISQFELNRISVHTLQNTNSSSFGLSTISSDAARSAGGMSSRKPAGSCASTVSLWCASRASTYLVRFSGGQVFDGHAALCANS